MEDDVFPKYAYDALIDSLHINTLRIALRVVSRHSILVLQRFEITRPLMLPSFEHPSGKNRHWGHPSLVDDDHEKPRSCRLVSH